ncbi:hypothetical protein [Psychrobacter sp. I-STPA6b]|uniref:hypothetical protein n=1 Tax=Psychrobacter sp. I-STPA6b TaxID=2585718 RepID=UPI001D0CC92F|nr:hypothetical protein [Psychrobacter sp. I-STPA6b]
MISLYFSILPIGFGIMTLVGSLICLVGYATSNEVATKQQLFPWFQRLLLIAFILLSIGIFFTVKYFI